MESAFYQAFCDLAVSPLQNLNRKLLGRARKRPSAKEQLDPGIWLFSKGVGFDLRSFFQKEGPQIRVRMYFWV